MAGVCEGADTGDDSRHYFSPRSALLRQPSTERPPASIMFTYSSLRHAGHFGGHVLVGMLIGEGELGERVGNAAILQQRVPVALQHRLLLHRRQLEFVEIA